MVGDDRRRRAPGAAVLVLALLGIVVLQVAVISLGDSRFGSGSDAGGRAAAVVAAQRNGACDHDLGYWAADADPRGEFHPVVNTSSVGGRFVQPASLAYVCAASGLRSLLGQPFALVVSVAGVLAAAAGAWLLERRAGGDGWLSLLLVGAVGPVAFYGSDTWEHAPATGCAVLGTALLLRRSRWSGLAAGLLWGLAIVLRLETATVALGLAIALLVVGDVRRQLLVRPFRLTLGAVAGLTVLVGDRLMERAVLAEDVRATRAVGSSGQLTQAGGDLAQRSTDALVTTIGLFATEQPRALLLGAGFVLGVVAVARRAWSPDGGPLVTAAGVFVVVLLVLVRLPSPGFVPGMLIAAPIASVGALVAFRRVANPVARTVAVAALISMPIVLTTQWTGTLVAQWGGRYLLTTGAFLTIAGAAVLRPRLSAAPVAVLVAVSILVGGFGLLWHVDRTRDYHRIWDDLASQDCEGALIATSVYFLREGGSTPQVRDQRVDGCGLLTAAPTSVPDALEVVADLGIGRASVLYRSDSHPPRTRFDGWMVEEIDDRDLGRIDTTTVRLRRR